MIIKVGWAALAGPCRSCSFTSVLGKAGAFSCLIDVAHIGGLVWYGLVLRAAVLAVRCMSFKTFYTRYLGAMPVKFFSGTGS